jgi:hypothetical protein
MKTLQIKRYFLSEKERETYEKNVLQNMPELYERVLEWDDKELLEKVESHSYS